jgi:hypothetical protein
LTPRKYNVGRNHLGELWAVNNRDLMGFIEIPWDIMGIFGG